MSTEKSAARRALERLRRRREELSLSQAALAEAVGVNPSYIGLLERGERVPSLDVLEGLARAVGMTLSELFASTKSDQPAEVAAIGTVLAAWPAAHRKAAVRVVREMDALLRAKPSR